MLASFVQTAQAQTRELTTTGELLDRVAAVVNDGVVLQSELDEQVMAIKQRLAEQKAESPPENILRQQVLERLVLQEIQMQRAQRANLKVPDETLNGALQDIAQRNNLPLAPARDPRPAGRRLRDLSGRHAQGADAHPAPPA